MRAFGLAFAWLEQHEGSSSPSTEELTLYAHLALSKFVVTQFTIASRKSRYGQEDALMSYLESSMRKKIVNI